MRMQMQEEADIRHTKTGFQKKIKKILFPYYYK